jgi:hypothetical protein
MLQGFRTQITRGIREQQQQQQLTAIRRNFIYNQRALGRFEIFMSCSSHRQTVLLRVESKTHTREIFIQIQIYNQFNRARRAASRITSPRFIIRNSQGRFHWAFCIRFVPDAKWEKTNDGGKGNNNIANKKSIEGVTSPVSRNALEINENRKGKYKWMDSTCGGAAELISRPRHIGI